MTETTDPANVYPTEFRAWHGWLGAFVGVVAATNIVLYGEFGKDRIIVNPAERLGYEMGVGVGLGLGITFVLYLLVLRKGARKWSALTCGLTALAGGLAVHFAR